MISEQAQWTVNLIKWISGGNLSFSEMIKDEGVIEGIVGYLDKQVPHSNIVKKQEKEIARLKKLLQKKETVPKKPKGKKPAPKKVEVKKIKKPGVKKDPVAPKKVEKTKKRKHYTTEDKIKILKDIQGLSTEDKNAYLKEHDISRSNIPKWKKAFPLDASKEAPPVKPPKA